MKYPKVKSTTSKLKDIGLSDKEIEEIKKAIKKRAKK